ncbi:unnamed protein product, partial [Meganyctiphanes norvegica]
MTLGRHNYFVWSILLVLGLSSTCNAVPNSNGRRAPLALQKNVVSKVSKIVGGYPASVGELPWQVALYGEYVCGGTLLSSDVVLTAAHCVIAGGQLITGFKVGYGGLSLLNLPFETDHKQVIPHPHYNEYTMDNDIALVILASPVKQFTNLVLPANLPYNSSEEYEGEEVTASGWGTLYSDSDSLNSKTSRTIEDGCEAECVACVRDRDISCSDTFKYPLKRDACGDSGGPLVKIIGDYSVIVGVTSWGNGCAAQGYPGVYTRVTESV